MLRLPAKVTWRRWWWLVRSSHLSLVRLLEYECVKKITFQGPTLDVGGGNAHYASLLKVEGRLHSVNMNSSLNPTVVADFGHGLPFQDGSYNSMVSLNTLEHILDDQLLLKEIHRVLSPGGVVHFAVPYMYQIHASPSDYHRHTSFFWEHALTEVGFSADQIEIQPLTFGAFGAPLSLLDMSVNRYVRFLMRFFLLMPIWLRSYSPFGLIGDGDKIPLGYFITARKS